MGDSKPLTQEAGSVDVSILLARLTAARAGFLDNLDNANLGTIDDISTLTAAVIAHLNVDIDSRAPANEYDTQLDANMSTRAPANEYDADITSIKTETDKTPGSEGEDTAATLNAHGGTATSGDTGADVVTISTSTRKLIHFLGIDISGLTATATATIRLYTKILNADASLTKFYDQDFVVGTDPDFVPVIDGSMGIRNDLRVEIQSDNASDTSVSVKYCYISEDME